MTATSGIDDRLETWDEVRTRTEFTGILVGNGASRAVWDGFHYDSLYDVALDDNPDHRLEPADVALFDLLQTRNFELVLAALQTAQSVTAALGVTVPSLGARYKSIHDALGEAVNNTHVPWAQVPDKTLETIRTELLNYKFVYSTNYDLLIYWAIMHQEGGLKDLFWGPYFDPMDTELFDGSCTVLYLHGGLHLFHTLGGRTRKRAATGGNLLKLFGTPLDEVATHLLISEGTAPSKLASIYRSDYLAFSYTKLAQHKGPICVFGHSLSDIDDHIVQALRKAGIHDIAISIRPGTAEDVISAKARAINKLTVASLSFYNATSHPLGGVGLRIEH